MGSASSCSKQGDSSEVLLSKVGNRSLYLNEVLSSLSDEELTQDSIGAVNHYVSVWEKRIVLRNEAERLGLHQNPKVIKELNDLEDMVLSDAIIRMYLADLDTISLSDGEWQEFVSLNPWLIKIPESSLLVYHFKASNRDSLEKIRIQIQAKQYSSLIDELKTLNPSWWKEQQIPVSVRALESEYPNLKTFWNSAKPGQITPILRLDNSNQFFWILERLDAGSVLDTTVVRPYIEDWLIHQKKNRKLKALEENLMVNARQNNLIQRPQNNLQ